MKAHYLQLSTGSLRKAHLDINEILLTGNYGINIYKQSSTMYKRFLMFLWWSIFRIEAKIHNVYTVVMKANK